MLIASMHMNGLTLIKVWYHLVEEACTHAMAAKQILQNYRNTSYGT